tara:strand:+ start:196 stop:381 length:186 start_codon:yes stop_codon:yes gene_type:complete
MKELLDLIDKKIEEIENYAIDTQENERQYIAWIGCLNEAKFLLRGSETTEDKLFISKLTEN